jgi:hypothetical protein
MRPKVKNARIEASKLHGASAQYVSLVGRGANETPFAVIKSANGAKAMTITKRKKAAKSHKTVASGRKNQVDKEFTEETLVAKMIFSADVFEDEDDVQSWIEDAEWETDSVQITKNADGDFEARPNDLGDDDFVRMSPVDIEEDGVSGFVGTRKIFLEDLENDPKATDEDEVDEDEAEDETVAEAKSEDEATDDEDEATDEAVDAEVTSEEKGKKKPKYSKRAEFLKKRQETRAKAKKFDAWDAMFSDSNTLTKAITAGMSYDTTPPGYNEVQFAFNTVVGNILGGEDEGKQDSLNKVAADYAEVIGGLDKFFDQYVEADEEEIAKFVESDEAKESLAKWAEDHADFLANDADGTAPTKTEKKAVVAKTADAAPTIDYNKVADLVAKAVAPLSEEVASVTGKVEKLATRRPTKKAAGPDDSGNAAPSTVQTDEGDDRWAAKKQSKALLG